MTNRETDGDIHGEDARLVDAYMKMTVHAAHCHAMLVAALEGLDLPSVDFWICRQPAEIRALTSAVCTQAKRVNVIEQQIDACRPYLKEGETPAECLARNRADIVRLMGKWGAEKMRSAKLRDDLDKIAQTTGSDDPCRPHLKEGETVADALIRMQKEITTLRTLRNAAMQLWAGRSTFDKEDAARYRLLRRGQHWSVIDGIGDTLRAEVLDAAIDKARAAQEVAG